MMMKLVHTRSIWALDLNVFSARVEKVADLDCLEGSDFQVVQTTVCVLQLQLHNSSSWTACQDIRTVCSQLLWGFSGHQESGAENKPTHCTSVHSRSWGWAVSGQILLLRHLKTPYSRIPDADTPISRCTLVGCNADTHLWLRQHIVLVSSSRLSWDGETHCHSLHVSGVSVVEPIQLFACWHIFHSSSSSFPPLPPSLAYRPKGLPNFSEGQKTQLEHTAELGGEAIKTT